MNTCKSKIYLKHTGMVAYEGESKGNRERE